jgi:hypothetical protein
MNLLPLSCTISTVYRYPLWGPRITRTFSGPIAHRKLRNPPQIANSYYAMPAAISVVDYSIDWAIHS